MLVGSSAHAGAGFGSSGGGNSSGVCACATTVLLVCTLVLVALSDHEPEIRSDYDNINRTCPMPSIFRSSSAVAGAFSTKRSVGTAALVWTMAWRGLRPWASTRGTACRTTTTKA